MGQSAALHWEEELGGFGEVGVVHERGEFGGEGGVDRWDHIHIDEAPNLDTRGHPDDSQSAYNQSRRNTEALVYTSEMNAPVRYNIYNTSDVTPVVSVGSVSVGVGVGFD